MYTTLNKIRAHDPCTDGWQNLLKYLGKTKADNEPLAFATILTSNGLDDAVWALVACDDQSAVRRFACDCAEHVLHIFEAKCPDDNRPRKAIEVARLFADGKVAKEELEAAGEAAEEAAWAAEEAVGAAARAAARAAAWDAAWDAAWAAAWAAAKAAAKAAAWAAAWDAEIKWQEELFKEYFCKGDDQ